LPNEENYKSGRCNKMNGTMKCIGETQGNRHKIMSI